jgi:hypothetical protein
MLCRLLYGAEGAMRACWTKTFHLNGSSCRSYLLPYLDTLGLCSKLQDFKLRDRHQDGDESVTVPVRCGMV